MKTPLAYSKYYTTVVFISLLGLFDSIYLSLSHYRNYTDINYQSFCAITRALNCDTVSQSSYSIFFNVPVPVWGIFGYAIFLFLLGFAFRSSAEKKRTWALLMLLAAVFSFFSILLAFISSYVIRSYCMMCIVSYAVNLALLYYTWIVRKRFNSEKFFTALKLDIQYLYHFNKISFPGVIVFASAGLIMILSFPDYWQMTMPVSSKEISSGINEEGYPWIGAENPELEIVEFSDYRCFQCKKTHYILRRLIQAHPDKIRLIHRHFPMDHIINPIVRQPFHIGAANLAIVSLFSLEKNKFWKMNDLLFDIPRQTDAINIRNLAEEAGFEHDEIQRSFQDPLLWKKLEKDIQTGIKYGLTGTPGFVINDQVYIGQIPAEILRTYQN